MMVEVFFNKQIKDLRLQEFFEILLSIYKHTYFHQSFTHNL